MGKTRIYQESKTRRGGGANYFNSPSQISIIMLVAALVLSFTGFSHSDTPESLFKPHNALGTNAGSACIQPDNDGYPFIMEGTSRTSARTFTNSTEITGGAIRSNGSIKVSGNSMVNGNATPAPGYTVIKTGNGTVTGSTEPAAELLNCSIGNIAELTNWVKANHNNNAIPPTDQGRMPWGCQDNPPPNEPWQFCLKGNETIHVPAGIYWFSSWKQSGNSKFFVDGYVRILVTGRIEVSGNSSINQNGNPYNLLVFNIPDTNYDLQLTGNIAFNALIYAPDDYAMLSGLSIVNGSLIAGEIKASGQAQLKRWIDETAPVVHFSLLPSKCTNSNQIQIRFTASDEEAGIDPEEILLFVDGNPVPFSVNSGDPYWKGIEAIASLTDFPEGIHQITASVKDRAGNIATEIQSIVIDRTTPSLAITYPADGAPLYQSQILVMGIATDNASEECELSLTVNGYPVEIQPDGQWLTTVNLQNGGNSIEAVAIDDAGNSIIDTIFVSYIIAPIISGMIPISLSVDPDGNGVIESGETVKVIPSWANVTDGAKNLDSEITNWRGPQGPIYTIVDGMADYGTVPLHSIVNCQERTGEYYELLISNRRKPHRDAWFDEHLWDASGHNYYYPWTVHIGNSFDDVRSIPGPAYSFFYKDIETVFHYGITGGCTTFTFCPQSNLTRWQMAVFIARALAMGDGNIPIEGDVPQPNGGHYNCSPDNNYHPLFTDILQFQCKYVHYLYAKRIVDKCSTQGPLKYCPNDNVTRENFAVAVAKAIAVGDESIPQTYRDQLTTNYYSCDAVERCDPFPSDLPFTDVLADDNHCRHIYYLWSKGVVGGCQSNRFCKNNLITREQAAAIIVRAFQLDLYKATTPDRFFCPSSGNLAWGGYDFMGPRDLTDADIDGTINLMSNYGLGEGFRIFMNAYFQHMTDGRFPYELISEHRYDLTQIDTKYWNNVARLISQSNAGATDRKRVFTLGHIYQCHEDPQPPLPPNIFIGPWCQPYNVNKIGDFQDSCEELKNSTICSSNDLLANIDIGKSWMTRWSTGFPSSLTNCEKAWIKCEYKRLAQNLLARGVNVVEIYNEASSSQSSITAHIDLIEYLRTNVTGLKIQVNIAPPWILVTDPNDPQYPRYPDFNDPVFQTAWTEFTTQIISGNPNPHRADYYAIHGLMPNNIDLIPNWMKNARNLFDERILEISTDGQHICKAETLPYADSLHDAAGEIFQKVMGLNLYPACHFEHDTIPLLVVTPIPELQEIKNVCLEIPGVPTSKKLMLDIKADCSDGPVSVAKGDDVLLTWNSINATSCTISPGGYTGTSGQEVVTINASTKFTLTCSKTGASGQDYVTVYPAPACDNGCCEPGENHNNCPEDCNPVCGNGVCEPPHETPLNCPQDCPLPKCPQIYSLSSDKYIVETGDSAYLTATGANFNEPGAEIVWTQNPASADGGFADWGVSPNGTVAYTDWIGPGVQQGTWFTLTISASNSQNPSCGTITKSVNIMAVPQGNP